MNEKDDRKAQPFVLAIALVVLCGCEPQNDPPVEVMNARSFSTSQAADGATRFLDYGIVPLKRGNGLVWVMSVRTNRPNVRYVEKVTHSGPATWGRLENAKYEISPDQSSITITRDKEATQNNGIVELFGGWGVTEEDPPGKTIVLVTIEGKVQRQFEFDLRKMPEKK